MLSRAAELLNQPTQVFMMTYPYFTTAPELLKELELRFDLRPTGETVYVFFFFAAAARIILNVFQAS